MTSHSRRNVERIQYCVRSNPVGLYPVRILWRESENPGSGANNFEGNHDAQERRNSK